MREILLMAARLYEGATTRLRCLSVQDAREVESCCSDRGVARVSCARAWEKSACNLRISARGERLFARSSFRAWDFGRVIRSCWIGFRHVRCSCAMMAIVDYLKLRKLYWFRWNGKRKFRTRSTILIVLVVNISLYVALSVLQDEKS